MSSHTYSDTSIMTTVKPELTWLGIVWALEIDEGYRVGTYGCPKCLKDIVIVLS